MQTITPALQAKIDLFNETMVGCRQKPWTFAEMVDCDITEDTPDSKVIETARDIASDMHSDSAENKWASYYEN